jgi:pimeloyl-ACP methyl ester carboxylesterase
LISPVFLAAAPFLKFLHGYFLRRLYGDPRRIRPGTLAGYSAPFDMPGAFRYGLSALRYWARDLEQLRAALPRIAHIPTLLVWGSRDKAVDPRSALPLSRQFHDCRRINFEGVGHLPYEEVPEEFNRAVVDFLA